MNNMAKILAIDDKEKNLIIISNYLRKLIPECRVITARSGHEGIKKAKDELPDTILLDIKMPQMDGFEVCQRLKTDKTTMNIPILMLTAMQTDVESRIRGLELGADVFLTVPIDEAELAAQIKAMLRLKKAEDVLRKEKDQIRRYNEELEEEVKKRTERIRDLEKQRSEIEKLVATGRMAARIAHEINNPLASIKNSFLLIKDAVSESHPYYDYVDRIEKEINRITRIVHQMMDLYRPKQGAPHEFQIREIINDVVSLLKVSCHERDVSISVDLPEDSVVGFLPDDSLRQVLFNILQNAIDASPEGGIVKVGVAVSNDRLNISVTDQGSGIPKDLGPLIFEPFFTTKGDLPKGGLGLGLSISRSLVEAMGGSIQFQSQANMGTVFRILLPRYGNEKEIQNG